MIEVVNLVKRYGSHIAVDNLSFTVEKGKVVGFLGPNGAGKSTTMNMITGYLSTTEGNVLIDGVNISEKPERAKKNIGYLPETPPLYPDMRVREYLIFVAELKKVAKSERDRMIVDIMSSTKILEVSERLIRHLSKGYKQRVGLAGAIMGYPDILILDEPTVGLDPAQIIEIRDLIRELSKSHTILLSSHIMQEISAVCDEIIIINEGKMIACDSPDHLMRKMEHSNGLHLVIRGESDTIKEALHTIMEIKSVEYDSEMKEGTLGLTVYSSKNEDIREQVFYALAQARCPLLEMGNKIISLEETFLALTQGADDRHKNLKKDTRDIKQMDVEQTRIEQMDVEQKIIVEKEEE